MRPLRGFIAAGVHNPVLVNLLMVCMLACGAFAVSDMVREAYPECAVDYLSVDVTYPGASPEDVERAICIPIEEAVIGLEGVREVMSRSYENYGTVWISLFYDVKNPRKVLDEVKQRIDQITTFPPDAEKPVAGEMVLRSEVINIAVYGDVPERSLKRFAQEVERELLTRPEISQIVLWGTREDEIIIEVSEEVLLAYGLSMTQLMDVVARSSLDLPAGVIRTAHEEVTLRITGQRYAAIDYENLVVIEDPNAVVRLGDIATVREGFEEEYRHGRFNGEPAVTVAVYKTPDQDSTTIAGIVREYVDARQAALPSELHMTWWGDTSATIDSMIHILLKNGAAGILLLFLTLLIFLQLRHAVWVAVGIPISFAGALVITHVQGGTINLISLFALIMVTGIIVDDAIVIAENIHSRQRHGDPPELASIEGAYRMSLPVLGASLTTIIAFVPLLYIVGVMGRFIYVLPVVVIAAIVASAVEAFFILPSHLCYRKPVGVEIKRRGPNRVRQAINRGIEHVITRWYRPVYRLALDHRGVTLSIATGAFLVTIGLILGGRTSIVILPKEDSNIIYARVRFPEGSPASVTEQAIERIEAAALRLNDDPLCKPATEGDLVRNVYSIAGAFPDFVPLSGTNLCEVRLEMMPAEQRLVTAERIMERWRDRIGTIPDVVELTIEPKQLGPAERPIEIRLMSDSLDDLAEASRRIQAKLREFEGVTDVHDDLIPGKRELHVTLRPAARSLGLTLDTVAKHLRHGFFGGEAVRLHRGRDQLKVRVRYPPEQRRSITDIENERIATPTGDVVPFLEVANVTWARGYWSIGHQEGKRRARVQANVDERLANAERIIRTLEAGFLDTVIGDFQGMSYTFGGDRKRMTESIDSLFGGFILAVIAIYTVLGALLRSYIQPLVIVIALPFGIIGAVFGHLLLGYDLTLMSLFGLVALSGVVVNDSLVLVDAINSAIREGKDVVTAVREAGELRFRAVVLTSITTVAGLLPLLLERSTQAKTVIPMAISLSFGVAFATLLTLFVVPSSFLLVNDARRLIRWLHYGGSYPTREVVEEATRDRLTAAERAV